MRLITLTPSILLLTFNVMANSNIQTVEDSQGIAIHMGADTTLHAQNGESDYDWTKDIEPRQINDMLKQGVDIKNIQEMVTMMHQQKKWIREFEN